jgi:hypothetical protein
MVITPNLREERIGNLETGQDYGTTSGPIA